MLSAEVFAEIIHALGKGDGVDPIHKNRRARRVQYNGQSLIYRIGVNPADATVRVQMRDISARGCSFTCNAKLAVASNFIMQFSRKNRPPVGVFCRVVHCRAATDGYRVGTEFTCALDNKTTSGETDLADRDRIRKSILT